ncbi:tetratricopeptide repeat protein [Acuticoccus sp. MNP-M23]|uniref:tetratricopeptide repeat protein n=1 Tax=Acuticoccus sp. MNP-M23 TaxID=3072793 RepID=UPI0028151B89|nr:tetratricopeptide repeat protein [Acuticoccus sp. MNP-M23]WMS41151.1 tetratricopeptide repeat protein [Acuticoccus sp. MNP-M23]
MNTTALRQGVVLACLAVAGCGFAVSANAQGTGEAASASASQAVESRRDALFAAMLTDPSNLDIAFEYATLSAQLGDFEAAIGTLERMLIYAPNLPRIQLELGVLYYRIGATEMARSYLEAAEVSTAPPEVRERVATFLAQVDRQDRRFLVSGTAYAGIRYQSNATAAPGEDVIAINGVPVRLDQNARAQADGNLFGLADIHMTYDLKNQYDLIEANLVTYGSVFFDVERLNLGLVEAQLGPSFGFGRFGFAQTRLGVYGIAGATGLDQALYTTTYGAGAVLRTAFAEGVLFETRNEFRAANYNDSPAYPTVRLQTGQEYSSLNNLTVSLSPQVLMQTVVTGRRVDARAGFKSYGELGASLRGTYFFYMPEFGPLAADAPWNASLAVGGLLRRFDDPDVLINAAASEKDEAAWIEAGISAPLQRGFSAFFTAQYTRQWSNYDTRDYDNAVFTFGLSRRF